MIKMLIFISVLLLSEANAALALGPAGEFQGRGEGKLFLSISKNNAVELTTVTKPVGCGGFFSGKGKMITSKIMEAKKVEFGKTCTVIIYFDNQFRNISTHEDDCVTFHGAACGFNGILKRVR